MKMRDRGLTFGGVPFGGVATFGGAHIALNTECKIFISHRNILRGILC